MPYDPNNHHRRSIRLNSYDYSQAGAYFVTMCAQNRELLFVVDDVVEMFQRWWDKLPEKYPGVETDAFVIMPNHAHGVIVTVGVVPRDDPGQTREYIQRGIVVGARLALAHLASTQMGNREGCPYMTIRPRWDQPACRSVGVERASTQ